MDRTPQTERMVTLKNAPDIDRITTDNPAGRQAFYEELTAHGAPLVREERMLAFPAGLIGERGKAVGNPAPRMVFVAGPSGGGKSSIFPIFEMRIGAVSTDLWAASSFNRLPPTTPSTRGFDSKPGRR